MNERIKELAQKFNARIDPGDHYFNQRVLEELIEDVVRECARKAGWTQGMASTHIFEHFGLER